MIKHSKSGKNKNKKNWNKLMNEYVDDYLMMQDIDRLVKRKRYSDDVFERDISWDYDKKNLNLRNNYYTNIRSNTNKSSYNNNNFSDSNDSKIFNNNIIKSGIDDSINPPINPSNNIFQDNNFNNGYRPITSYGFICLKFINNKAHILLIRRKHSYAFVNFVLGKYDINDLYGINKLFREMTDEEKDKLRDWKFSDLWNDIWNAPETRKCLIKKYGPAKERFINIRNGIYINPDYNQRRTMFIKLENFIKFNKSKFIEPDWGFPKGKKEKGEQSIDCAKRELFEETNLKENDDYIHLDKIYPLFEQYHGTDDRLYKHIYYVGIINQDVGVYIDQNNPHQQSEIGDIGFYDFDTTLRLLKGNNRQKQKMLYKLIEILDRKYPELIEGIEF